MNENIEEPSLVVHASQHSRLPRRTPQSSFSSETNPKELWGEGGQEQSNGYIRVRQSV